MKRISKHSVIRSFDHSIISRTHQGSALLIVLGMLAFMLVSAIGFSAYMRYARLPSSFLRRSSASRLLAKAALAEAIDEIDAAVGNNPHPGFGKQQPRAGAGSLASDLNGIANEDLRTRNHWRHRVYIGTNQLCAVEDTVSTLTLEGLAYIPPALVNEARYYSRRSSAGTWRSLGFDSGRYAFCAIDVSDHFDVNALASSLARDSSPGGRISLAYLFEDANHQNYANAPKTWDDFLVNVGVRKTSSAEAGLRGQKKTVDPACVPFVSVADLNLAIHDKKPAGWESPFCRYIKNGGSEFLNAVGVTDPTGAAADKVKRMSFVADGYFPAAAYANAADADYDLATADGQPFTKADLEAEHPNLDGIQTIARSTKTGSLLYDRLGRIGCAMLYDYLDDDNLPVSLAMPSVERTPMIAGIGLEAAGGKVTIKAKTKESGSPGDLNYEGVISGGGEGAKARTVRRTTYYNFDGADLTKFLSDGTVKSVLAYPFRRGVDLDDPTSALKFSLEGCLAFFFTYSNERFFHMRNDALAILPEHFTDKKAPNGSGVTVFRVPLKFSDFQNSSFGVVKTETDAVREYSVSLGDSGMRQSIGEYLEKDENAILTVIEEWQQTPVISEATGKTTGWTPEKPADDGSNITSAKSALQVLTDKGFNALAIGRTASVELTPRVALWLRVKNGNGNYNTTDLVPAGVFEDDAFLGNQPYVDAADYLGRFPLMVFSASSSFKVGKADLEAAVSSPVEFTFGPNCLVCADPRFNWAPENWYAPAGSLSKQFWLDEAKKLAREDNGQGHDCDIFLATSDAGYMQSVYELAMLPRLTPLANGGTSSDRGNLQQIDGTWSDYANAAGQELNRDYMWTSYHPYDINGVNDAQAFRDLGIVNEGGGFKVSPFSDSTNVVMAVFANTPCDWWAAATNTESRSGKIPHIDKNDRLDAKEFNKAYALCEMNADAKLEWFDAEAIAQRFIYEMARRRDDNTVDWCNVYDGLGWDEEDFCGVNGFQIGGAEPSDVDRKFLYGYWRECFAVKQQLFLVFVRAEPMMTGGGALGQTPPQLGSRAVALVWRDPTASNDNNTPHRTRVLFYRQFD